MQIARKCQGMGAIPMPPLGRKKRAAQILAPPVVIRFMPLFQKTACRFRW